MKTSLPLPTESKKLPWTRELERCAGKPFCDAKHWHISFTKSDVEYIKNVIQTHKLYDVIYKQGIIVAALDNNEALRRYRTEIEFLTPFMNDSKCPADVKNFLYCYIGRLQYNSQVHHEEKPSVTQFFIKSWMETCR